MRLGYSAPTAAGLKLYELAHTWVRSLILVCDSIGRLCVLRGQDIQEPGGLVFNSPPIVFGALVLNSLYFAADIATGSVGFSQKDDPNGELQFECIHVPCRH